ncbi:MAG: porin family protein [Bacteroidales bacterium]|nr:porin family protein [Bacteroidales bacterium]
MKTYIYIIASAAIMFAAAVQMDAQVGKRYYINGGWQFNATVDNPVAESANGWGAYIEGGYYLTPRFAIGGFASVNTNNEYVPKKTYFWNDGSALTTDMDYSVYQIPFGATMRYRFTRTKLQPYIEAKLGAEYSKEYAYMSTFGSSSDNWGFYVSPEAGITWHPFNRTNFGFQAAVYYSYATNRNTAFNMNGINNVGFKLGICF